MSTVNMTKTLVGPRARRDDPTPLRIIKEKQQRKRECRKKKGGREDGKNAKAGLAGGNGAADFSLSYLKGCRARKN